MNRYGLTLGAIFGFISVITTLGVHLITVPTASFEESAQLYNNTTYLFSRWWVIFHCMAVLISMCGVYLALTDTTNIHARLGMISFGVFSWTEITRMFLVLTYLGHLRESYLKQSDAVLKSILRADIENFRYIGEGLFTIFILAFALGNFFYGIELLKKDKLGRVTGAVLLIWFCVNILALISAFAPVEGLDEFFEYFNITFQPFARALTAFWLLRQIRQ